MNISSAAGMKSTAEELAVWKMVVTSVLGKFTLMEQAYFFLDEEGRHIELPGCPLYGHSDKRVKE